MSETPHNRITTSIRDEDLRSEEARARRRDWQELLDRLDADRREIRAGGGERGVKRQHDKGRMTARERITALVDPGTDFHELGLYAAWGRYEEIGGAPGAGVVTGIGRIGGRPWMIIANDATVKAGSFTPPTAKKVIRAQTIAMENRTPTVYLVDSAGVFLPMQDEIFPDQDDFGRVFRNNAVMSARGIPQIAAIMGNCVAGGAYLPIMCDKVLMTEGSGLYLAGPALVKAAIGQEVSSEELGGATMHAEISGTVDFKEKDDAACLERIRYLADQYAPPPPSPFRRVPDDEREPANFEAEELLSIVPAEPGDTYDMREVIVRLVDGGDFAEYRPDWGPTLVCGYGRMGGYSVGIVANQKTHVQDERGFFFGGVIYADSADKASRFILDCCQTGVPLLFIHDVNGFMVGKQAEESGIIRSGAKMVNAVSNANVPKISLIVGGSYGAGHYAMCGKAYDPRFLFAWPSARYAVMGGDQAARTITDLQVAQMKKAGRDVDEETVRKVHEEIAAKYGRELDIRYAGSRLWVDEVISPLETRARLVGALETVAGQGPLAPMANGVLQT